LKASEAADLTAWFQAQLGTKASRVKTTKKLHSHPCVITVEEMAAARHFIKTQAANFSEEQRYNILQPQLEINPSHPIIKKLSELRKSNPKLASLVAEQLFANAMVAAGLVEDPRTILNSINDLLTMALEKH
jgi:TNF receptor-associated protein 1